MPFDFQALRKARGLRGKRVLLRLDLNMPVRDGKVADDFRLVRSAPTLEFLASAGAKVCVISHREDKAASTPTLLPAFERIRRIVPAAAFARTISGARELLARSGDGALVVLENLRAHEGEKRNDATFARELASLGDMFVNEAFSVSHRQHASIVGVPRFLPSFAGFLFAEEVLRLSRAFAPDRPALFVLGGAKFETKLPLIEKFLGIADDVFVCGALANDIYRGRGYETGASLVSGVLPDPALLKNPRLHAPVDVVVRGKFQTRTASADGISPDERITDAGPRALDELRALVGRAAFVLWNGPLGEYESGFDEGTVAAAQMIAESDAESVIGGGDSLAVVSTLGLLERFSFASTGGGAMLQFLADETLPGIEALKHEA